MAPPVSPSLQCIPAVQGGRGMVVGVCALLTALLGFSQAVSLGKDRCSPWEIRVEFLDNCLKAAVCGKTAGVFLTIVKSLCAEG